MRGLGFVAMLGMVAIGVTLWVWGQPLVSRSGEIRLWVGSVWSRENSQQMADWYSLSHMVHGMLIALFGRALGRWVPFRLVFAAAIATGVAWEIAEHTDWVLDRFRGQTIYQGYSGDTVLNAVCDYVFMLAGFAIVAALPWGWGIVLILALEGTSAVLARDSLILTTIRVVHPIPSLTRWQDETRPVEGGLPLGQWQLQP